MNGEIYTLEELSLTDLLLIKFLTVFDYLSLLIGGLPLPVIRLISNIRTTWGKESVKFPRVTETMTKGLTLPANVGELGPDITSLDLSACYLSGCILYVATTPCTSKCS